MFHEGLDVVVQTLQSHVVQVNGVKLWDSNYSPYYILWINLSIAVMYVPLKAVSCGEFCLCLKTQLLLISSLVESSGEGKG